MKARIILWEVLVGLSLGLALGLLGYRRRLLSRGGAVVVGAIMTLVFGGAGWEWASVLFVYLLTAGLWTAYRSDVKDLLAGEVAGVPYGGAHVMARVGWPLVLTFFRFLGSDTAVLFAAFVGSVAASLADTWSTQIGILSRDPPRLVTTGQRVKAGTPGAVSVLGVVAALGGTWLIGFLSLGLLVLSAWIDARGWDRCLVSLPLSVTVAGVAASLVDSLLGATAQVVYYCERCGERTENHVHHCGAEGKRVRGVPWLTNNAIDLVISLVGAALSALVVGWLARLVA